MAQRKRITIVSSNYPGPDNIYGDVFVHVRVLEYLKLYDVSVLGYNPAMAETKEFVFEGVEVKKVSTLADFELELQQLNPDLIAIHFMQHQYAEILLRLNKPLAIFIHGYEALSWRRRLMNYVSPGDWPYLLEYIKANRAQLKSMRGFFIQAGERNDIAMVLVSKWLKRAVEEDLAIAYKKALVIPNGINTTLFKFQQKSVEHRKKILVIRSFRGRNYANDISIDAILKLSTKSFFGDLHFTIYGDGYLYQKLTDQIKHFPNVTLNNFFVLNKDIPAIHENYGIFLCPSRLDTQGVSMCEAMSSGLVPIASPIGGIPEYAEDQVSSFQVSTADEIADKVTFLYHNPDVFIKMSKAARKAIEDRTPLSGSIAAEVNLFDSLTGVSRKVQQCTRCVLDSTDDPAITFDANGLCSFCRSYDAHEKEFVRMDDAGRREREAIIEQIKRDGQGKPYDCVIGLSGGVDSTYLAWLAKELGLRPLAVHFDNGWNSELAVNNIENIVTRLGLDLQTYVIDWEEFRDLQLSFLKASVVDIEMITDHAIIASLHRIALDHGLKYILSGGNYVTESVLPPSWIHNKHDHVHIRAIHKRFGTVPVKKFPLFNSFLKFKSSLRSIRSVSLLNYYPYIKSDVKKLITEKLHWRDYGGKHYESVFTRFYQGYILREKFGIDKRKAHLSNLICAGQITKADALEELRKPAYDETSFKKDYVFVLKKLELSESDFRKIMTLPRKEHAEYPIDTDFYKRYPVARLFAPVWRIFKKIRTR